MTKHSFLPLATVAGLLTTAAPARAGQGIEELEAGNRPAVSLPDHVR